MNTIIKAEKTMGHKIKIQRVERGTTKSYYVNFPAALAEAAQIQKGEELEWLLEDRNTFILRRVTPKKSALKRVKPLT
jgi:hypothetical protein